MNSVNLFRRYQELQRYVGWTDDDARRVQSVGHLFLPHFEPLIEDFYAEIQRHPNALRVITGGAEQLARLKGTLGGWLREFFAGPYDEHYVARRWRVGWRHVEIGLDQVYTNVALSRLRRGLLHVLETQWHGDPHDLAAIRLSFLLLLDLDLAIIEDAYQNEYLARQQRIERLATIGQVAGGIAHELRNPLNVVKMSAYYLLHSRNCKPEKLAEHLERIERQVGLADNVITALTSIAKMPVPNLRPVTVTACVAEALEANPLGDGIDVAVDCPADLGPALADADQIRIVLGNLLRNARDAMPHGGRLSISARSADGSIEIAVADTGVGIAPENLGRVLEPLFSTKARGLGLGLSTARLILDKNQGSLSVTSAVGRGTTFLLRLPAAANDGEPRS